MSFLKIWGCKVFVKRMISDKLGPKSDKCIFIGYPTETKGYYFYHQCDNKVFVARHGVFLEKEFLSRESSGSSVRLEDDQSALQDEMINDDHVQPPMDIAVSGRRDESISQEVVEEVQISPLGPNSQEVVNEVQGSNPQEFMEEVPESQAPVLRRSTIES